MKRKAIKTILQFIVSVITALIAALSTTSCLNSLSF